MARRPHDVVIYDPATGAASIHAEYLTKAAAMREALGLLRAGHLVTVFPHGDEFTFTPMAISCAECVAAKEKMS